MRLNLLSSFSSAQGSKFMDIACGSRVLKVMCQLFSAPVHTKVPPLASCSFRPRASLRGAELFFGAALDSHLCVSLLRERSPGLLSLTDPVSALSLMSSEEEGQ